MDPAVLRRELSAIALTLLAVFLTGALVFNAPAESQPCLEATGVFGPAGTWARCALVSTVGIPGAAIVSLGCLVVALTLFGRIARADDASDWGVLFAGVVTLVPVAIGLALGGEPMASDSAGLWGSFVAHYLRKGLGSAGAWVFSFWPRAPSRWRRSGGILFECSSAPVRQDPSRRIRPRNPIGAARCGGRECESEEAQKGQCASRRGGHGGSGTGCLR